MRDADMNPQQAALLELVPRDGATLGNIAARTRLGWTESTYAAVRDALIASGSVVPGRGRGGTLRRVLKVPALIEKIELQPHSQAVTTPRSVAVVLAELQQIEREIEHAAAALRALW